MWWSQIQRIFAAAITINPPVCEEQGRNLQGIKYFAPFISCDRQHRGLAESPRSHVASLSWTQDYSPRVLLRVFMAWLPTPSCASNSTWAVLSNTGSWVSLQTSEIRISAVLTSSLHDAEATRLWNSILESLFPLIMYQIYAEIIILPYLTCPFLHTACLKHTLPRAPFPGSSCVKFLIPWLDCPFPPPVFPLKFYLMRLGLALFILSYHSPPYPKVFPWTE